MSTDDTSVLFAKSTVRKGTLPKLEGFALDAKQRRQWTETRAALLWRAPALSHIFYTMMVGGLPDGVVWSRDVPIAATDDKHVILNPDTFFTYPLAKRVFIVAHEIMHAVLSHCTMFHACNLRGSIVAPDGRKLDYYPMLANIAADYVINDMLIESNIGEYDPGWLHDKNAGTHMDGVPTVYSKLFDQAEKRGGKGTGANGQKGFDEHLEPGSSEGKDANTAVAERSDAEWAAAIAAGMASAKAQGKLPAAMERFFSNVLEPQVEWQDRIRALFQKVTGDDTRTWRRPNRRHIVRDVYLPGKSGFAAGTVAVAVDTSGSIGNEELAFFMAEIKGIINDVHPERVLVMWCDAEVHTVDEISDEDEIRDLKPKGGGGTDFRPVFKWLDDEDIEPDCLIYLTDLYGSFPKHVPTYPVIWARTSTQAVPFGDVVDVPIKST